eukprot:TRINITY_DN106317_c0_g1_i1.p1 TRINITY_DN106317_c0_g1~~TRINITY_DN106317_c0_g1_i1.p1  ORF type:complete len:136 (+),score=51.65 TRINITY_DN106317_c0_g1_i1:43-408(+)
MAEEREAFRSTGKRFSELSEIALGQLSGTDSDLQAIEGRVSEIATAITAGSSDLSALKTELAQLESQAKQLETKGVDDVYTGELSSGKQLAKDSKKDMLRRLEKLFERMEAIFADLKKKGA